MIVIAVIGILMAMLLPALRRAREMGRRAVCMSNLRQWGVAWQNYATDNDDQVLETLRLFAHRYPTYMTFRYSSVNTAGSRPAGFNVESINPYILAFNPDNYGELYPSIFLCPSDRITWEINFVATCYAGHSWWFASPYSYFGQVAKWEPGSSRNGAASLLTDRELHPDRLLMSDKVYRWHGNGMFIYNHTVGREFAGFGEPPLAGLNQLYGDTSVHWKGRADLDTAAMTQPATYPHAWVAGGGGGNPDATFF